MHVETNSALPASSAPRPPSYDEVSRALVQHHATMRRVALRVLGDPFLADDAVQDASLKALRSGSGPRERRRLRGWLCTITRNAALDLVRRRDLLPILDQACGAAPDLDALPSPAPTPAGEPGPGGAIARALAALPPDSRWLISHAMQTPQKQLAQVLGLGYGALRTRLHRARAQLDALLRATGNPRPGKVRRGHAA
ncbi:MAG: RNA polymerase sigma factor [Planctomycetes bacterium]|nr:RNA polymerase sigma factor [Planctomycetota bacterium]MCB9870547.1 RNA polymerase sigma factor [Planctomycetota bacterium]MCB9889715.1 RNA polymerase sigma factor [Planctomycetota bacterium]